MSDSYYIRGEAPREGIMASNAISGSEWTSAARLQNHIAGRGRVLVPAFRPDNAALTKTVVLYGLRMVPSYQALVRRWRISAQTDGDITVSINGGTAVVDPAPGASGDATLPRGIVIDEVLGSQSASETAAAVSITSSDGNTVVESIECFELPRATIAEDANELGVNLANFRGSAPIRADVFENIYAGAVDFEAGKRVLFQWAVPYNVGAATSVAHAATTTSGTFANIFDVAKPCLARKIFNDGASYTSCSARVLAWVSGGGGGEVRVASAAGNSSVATISATSPAWSSEITDARILHEDIAAADGIPGGGYDDVQFEFRRTAGTLYVASAILYE